MTWKGMVSHVGEAIITPRHATASTPQAASTRFGALEPNLSSCDAVSSMAHGFDRGRGSELLAQAAHAHVDEVRPGVVAVAPHLGQQPLPADDLAGMRDEVVKQPELPVGEVG